jgi:hypothetical protein
MGQQERDLLDSKCHNPCHYDKIDVNWNLKNIILVKVVLTQKVGRAANDPKNIAHN